MPDEGMKTMSYKCEKFAFDIMPNLGTSQDREVNVQRRTHDARLYVCAELLQNKAGPLTNSPKVAENPREEE